MHSGARRSILLLEAPRSEEAAAQSAVEAAGAAAAALPQLAERCRLHEASLAEPAGPSGRAPDMSGVSALDLHPHCALHARVLQRGISNHHAHMSVCDWPGEATPVVHGQDRR
jgi:hypothetical protein